MRWRSLLQFALTAALAPNPMPAQTQPYQDRYITVNGLRLHYLDWGSPQKPPFIMLHGIGRVAHQFDHLAPHFQRDYHVMAIDMRGHGDSAWSPDAAYLVELLGDLLRAAPLRAFEGHMLEQVRDTAFALALITCADIGGDAEGDRIDAFQMFAGDAQAVV